jgi:hypothetical protein
MRYNLEKKAEGRLSGKLPENQGETAERLADEYQVSRDTIEKDGQFAEAVDTLETEVRQDIRASVLKRKSRDDRTRTTKKQVGRAGQAIQERRVEPLPFMRRAAWKDYQVIEAITLLAEAEIGLEEQAQLNDLLDRPHIPAKEGLEIVRNLAKADTAQRQRIYALHGSVDPREQSLALPLAAKKAPEPDPQVLIARRLGEAVGDVRRRE